MIIKDERGNELLEIIDVEEKEAEQKYSPVNHALAVVKVGEDYLMGWNHFRKDWEIFGGCMEERETLRECIERECYEELGLSGVEYTFLGLMKFKMAPGYFNPEWHTEYGGLYGVSLPLEMLETMKQYRMDKEEIERISFYREIGAWEKKALIDEKLLEYWR